MKTIEIVKKMRNESAEVKTSIGGTKSFRSIMYTVCDFNSEITDDGLGRIRSNDEIAEIVEKKHSREEIESVINTYELEKKGN